MILLLVLIATLFATSKSIYEEIEDRTMLTLMSKPVQQVGSAGRQVPRHHRWRRCWRSRSSGVILILCTWWRMPGDYQIRTSHASTSASSSSSSRHALMHITGLVPSLLLMWLQISVLAAIGVALSTRFSLVVNLPAVILLYIAGNLTRFLFPLDGQGPLAGRGRSRKASAYVDQPGAAVPRDVRPARRRRSTATIKLARHDVRQRPGAA